jgi:hypothetical protein
MEIKQNILNVNEWLTPTFDATTQEAVKELLGSKELEESFYKDLDLELAECGVMGVGNNRINKYTLKVRKDFLIICIKPFLTNL